MKIGTGRIRYTYRGIDFCESDLFNDLKRFFECNNNFVLKKVKQIVNQLNDEEIEQAYWTIKDTGIRRVLKNEIKKRKLDLSIDYDDWILSKINDWKERQQYFENYVYCF